MLHACMIEGFGWFRDSDYRRSWLFFDEVIARALFRSYCQLTLKLLM